MDYELDAIPANGYKFSHWQVVGRASNNPNDVYNKIVDVPSPISIDLRFQRSNGIKSPLVYFVAHFKPVEPVLESPPTTFEPEPEEPEGEFDHEPYLTTMSNYKKDEILRALDDITTNVEKIRNRVEGK
ncbi:MAG: hypothetical protein SVO01_02810 [Thermotogota bacterium]|nr:hypothetical protein [Thermotogota bacterium]